MEESSIQALRIEGYRLDKESEKYAKEIAREPGVKDLVLFPDAFTKEKYSNATYKVTVPSSAVIVSEENTLYPQFRSRGINCGMMVIALPIVEGDLHKYLFRELENTFLYTIPYYLNYRLRQPFVKKKTDLSYKEFLNVLQDGAFALKEKHNIKTEDLEKMEWKGRKEHVDIKALKKIARSTWLKKRTVRMRYSFGRNFTGNHYFELQVVEEDNPELNLKKGQVVAMVHSGCQSLEDVVREDLRREYITQNKFIPAPKESEMYDAFFLAQNTLMNLISAYRAITFVLVRDLIKELYGDDGSYLVLERGHNHVQKETINGENKLVYRHNAEKLEQGGFAIVSGDQSHGSYIVKGGTNTNSYYNTIDHGLGNLLEFSKDREEKTRHGVQIIRAKNGINHNLFKKKSIAPYLINEVESEYISFMKEKGIIDSHTKLRPVFNLKFSK